MPDGPRHLFLLAPMRSGSTLLASILCSHPEVFGYGETHVVYDSPAQLGELAARVCRAHGTDRPRGRLLFDKLLHDGLLPRPEVLAEADLTCLFLLREPRRTLQSLVHQLGSTLDDAFGYYGRRLAALEVYARTFPRSAFVAYEELAGEPDRVLAGLGRFLGLATPLSPEYRLQPLHDVKGVGDRSPAIRAGRILAARDLRHLRHLDVELPADRLAEAEESYRGCRALLEATTLSM